MSRETFECPNCGADVPVGRKACRECGSDDLTGWQSADEIDYQSIDIPDGYGPDGFETNGPRRSGWSPLYALVAILVALGVLLLALGRW